VITDELCIAVGQLNPTVGAVEENRAVVLRAAKQAAEKGAALLVLPEMCLSGYPLQDLALHRPFVHAVMEAARRLAEETADIDVALALGGPLAKDGEVYNALYVMERGLIRTTIRKSELPNQGVFDEKRVFTYAMPQGPVAICGTRVGFAICEDFWHEDVAETLVETGAELLVLVNGSPYETDKYGERVEHMVTRVVETGLPLLYVNLVGGQDDQVYDGGSFILNPKGRLAFQAPFFEEGLWLTQWSRKGGGWECRQESLPSVGDRDEMDYRCLVVGLRDFVRKNGFTSVILGLSGGVDSAFAAAVAVDALGAECVQGLMLPSRFTSEESLECARNAADALGIELNTVPIEESLRALSEGIEAGTSGGIEGTTAENLQARARGVILMAIANAEGSLLLATGNKSEIAVGYATLYGDMCGGYAPLKDVYKSRVFALSRWRNERFLPWMRGPRGAAVPERIIEREPTAELRDNQFDRDSLPCYETLDAILQGLIEGDLSAEEIVEQGFDTEEVARTAALVRGSEFKRYQSAPGPKITRRAFWLERRYPVTNRFREVTGSETGA